MILPKPLKITLDYTEGKGEIDYELVGKVFDNILIVAMDTGKDIFTEGGDYTTRFAIGKTWEYVARLRILKSYYDLNISYLRDIPKNEAKNIKSILPKDKKKAEAMQKAYQESKKESAKNAPKKSRKNVKKEV